MDSVKIDVNPGEMYSVQELISKASIDAFGIITNGLLYITGESTILGDDLEFVSKEEALEILRHSTAHLMAQAVKHLFPNVKLGVGPSIENGFYYDMLVPSGMTEADLERIEKEMQNIAEQKLPVERRFVTKVEAKELFESRGETFKVEILDDIADETVSIYSQGDYVDLCRGPHVNNTGLIKHFKLLNISGAYWRGDEKREQLTRIYGTSFWSEEELEQFLHNLEEADKRDHRKLGKQMDLFSINEDIGPGLILWHPNGAIVRKEIEDYWRETHIKQGYQLVFTPHVARTKLWEISGHLSFYKENMFPSMELENQSYLVKPMNCPFHVQIYKTRTRSYKEMPIRFAELGTVYRFERSGVLHGLLRVRGFTQDDAHIFCTRDQVQEEVESVLDMALDMNRLFGFEDLKVELSVRDSKHKDKYVGDDDVWELAESALANALRAKDLKFTVEEGEAKFYGPAIDIKVGDALGRYWQGPTIQVDFNLPRRFEMKYTGPDGLEHEPVMIHRTLLGSMERFFALLIEQYAGWFPLWVAPEQVRVVPITEEQMPFASEVARELQMFRVTLDTDTGSKLGYRVRKAQNDKVPYILVIGKKEVESNCVSVRHGVKGDLGQMSVEELKNNLSEEIEKKVHL
ncbi:threonine--tRNA ligase [Coprothermobacter platensis]|uniref:threonine--tRNA ligase n=1 Tax=Coprothermobacter platensis TaxID=108819 RepID=UPI00036D5653|nr:threonine--tRNA ligase [Coprothermobacter platensis]